MSKGSMNTWMPDLENFKTEFSDVLKRYRLYRSMVTPTGEDAEELLIARLFDGLEKTPINHIGFFMCMLNDAIDEIYAESPGNPPEYANALVREAFILKGKVFDIMARYLKVTSVIDTTKRNAST